MYGSSESLTFWDTLPSNDVIPVNAKVKKALVFQCFLRCQVGTKIWISRGKQQNVKKTHQCFNILEQNVHQTLLFIDRIESRIKQIIADSPAADPRTLPI